MNDTKILGLAGSLRERSYNRALLRAAGELLPEGATLETASIALPLYDADLGTPPEVEALKARVAAADALLIASPEYNYGIPGPLKNALDWVSRPAYASVMRGKAVGILGATGSRVGTARMQAHLRQVLFGMVAKVLPYPEVLVSGSSERFDDDLRLVHEPTRDVVRGYLAELVAFAR